MNVGVAELFRVALVTFVTIGVAGLPANRMFNLPQRPLKLVAVNRIVMQGFDANDPVVFGGGRHQHLAAELALLVCLTLGDALHLGWHAGCKACACRRAFASAAFESAAANPPVPGPVADSCAKCCDRPAPSSF